MAGSLDAERTLHAAVIAGWIEDQAPEPLQAALFDLLDTWQADGTRPIPDLWSTVAALLREQGCRDAELACWRALSGLLPSEPSIRVRLAEIHQLRGEDAEARALLADIPPGHPARPSALLLRLDLAATPTDEVEACIAELLPILAAAPAWQGTHHRLIRALVARGRTDAARAFLADWVTAHPADQGGLLLELGWLAMHAGDAALARSQFKRLWAKDDPDIRAVAGRFDGTVPPYTPEMEQAIRARIDAAFALPDADLARLNLPQAPLPSQRVLFVGFDRLTFPNDLAEHVRRSADAAGVALDLYLDSAIVYPAETRCDDDTVRRRVEAFEAEVERRRPEVVALDCAYMPTLRGLAPARMRDLADRLGFRLVCMMRDAMEPTLAFLEAWGAVADTMVIFDPGSAVLRPEHSHLHARIVVAVLPAQHLERGEGERDLGLLFLGSNTYGVRNMLLSVLLTEDIPFTAITGEVRAAQVPDLDAYAGLLRRARAVLNVAAHSRTEFLITGRVFEAMACGAVLIEQDNAATAALFTPWRHYLPWTNVDDIVQLCRFVERNPDVARRMAAEARSWLDRHYDCRRFWSAVLNQSPLPNPPPAEPGEGER
ncbi:glycosyltransferase [Paramagnetospirillum marisnigri]|uniref:glycosyltransferase n=1 Tax=Paramagnetospirillum marisnigri TaxID=1285242 RepID=UPI000A5AB8D6|nr:glycosyltransferase [Paramagnetospirillum marisnigri]